MWRRRGLEPRTAVLLREMFRLTARSRACITVLPRLHIGRALPPAAGAFHPVQRILCAGALLMRRRKTMTRLPNGAWSGGRDSNPRPSDWKSDALPAELPPHISERGQRGVKSLSLGPRSGNIFTFTFSQFPPKRTVLKESGGILSSIAAFARLRGALVRFCGHDRVGDQVDRKDEQPRNDPELETGYLAKIHSMLALFVGFCGKQVPPLRPREYDSRALLS